MRLRHRFLKIKHPKRFIIICTSVIVALALIAYGILSYFAWKGVGDYSKNAGSFLKQTINEELGAQKEGASSEERIASVLSKFSAEYRSSTCAANGLYEWQTVIPAANDIKIACEARAVDIKSTITALEELIGFYQDQTKASVIVTEALAATKTPTDLGAARDTWLHAMSTPTVANDSEAFTPVTQKIVTVAESLKIAYDELATATTSKSRSQYDAAVTKLAAAYAQVAEIQPIADVELQKLVDTFLKAYEAL